MLILYQYHADTVTYYTDTLTLHVGVSTLQADNSICLDTDSLNYIQN